MLLLMPGRYHDILRTFNICNNNPNLFSALYEKNAKSLLVSFYFITSCCCCSLHLLRKYMKFWSHWKSFFACLYAVSISIPIIWVLNAFVFLSVWLRIITYLGLEKTVIEDIVQNEYDYLAFVYKTPRIMKWYHCLTFLESNCFHQSIHYSTALAILPTKPK